jgi:hypothetical protein
VIGDIGADIDGGVRRRRPRRAGAHPADAPRGGARSPRGRTRPRGGRRAAARRPGVSHVLVVRFDNAGDVLLAGPAVRAVAAGGRPRHAAVRAARPRRRRAAAGRRRGRGVARAVDRPRARAGHAGRDRRSGRAGAGTAHRPRGHLRLLPPEPPPHRARPAAGRRAAHRGDVRRLPRLAPRPPPPDLRRRARGRALARPRASARLRAPAGRRRRAADPPPGGGPGPSPSPARTSWCIREHLFPRARGSPRPAPSSSRCWRPTAGASS